MRSSAALLPLVLVLFFAVTGIQTACTDREKTTIKKCMVSSKMLFMESLGRTSCRVSRVTKKVCKEYDSMKMCIKNGISNPTCMPFEGTMATRPLMREVQCSPKTFEMVCKTETTGNEISKVAADASKFDPDFDQQLKPGERRSKRNNAQSLGPETYKGCTEMETNVTNNCKRNAKPVFVKSFGEMSCQQNISQKVCNEYKSMKTCIKRGTSATCKPLEGEMATQPVMVGIKCSPKNFEDSCMSYIKGCAEIETTVINNCKSHAKPVFMKSFDETSCNSFNEEVCNEYKSMKACIARGTSATCKPLEGEMATYPIMIGIKCSPENFEDACNPQMKGQSKYPECTEQENTTINNCKKVAKPVLEKSFGEMSCKSNFTNEVCNEYQSMKECISMNTTCKPLEGEMATKPIMSGVKCSPEMFEDFCFPDMFDTETGCFRKENTVVKYCKINAKPVFAKSFGETPCRSNFTEEVCKNYYSLKMCIMRNTRQVCESLENDKANRPIMPGINCSPKNLEDSCMPEITNRKMYKGCTEKESALINDCKRKSKPVFMELADKAFCETNVTDDICYEYNSMITCIMRSTNATCNPLEGEMATQPIMTGVLCSPKSLEDSCTRRITGTYPKCTKNETTVIDNCKMKAKQVFVESFGAMPCKSNFTRKVCNEYELMKMCIKNGTSMACKPLEGEMAKTNLVTGIDCSPKTFEDSCLPEIMNPEIYAGCTVNETTNTNICKVKARPVLKEFVDKASCSAYFPPTICKEYKAMNICITRSTNGTCKPLGGMMASKPIMTGVNCTPKTFEDVCKDGSTITTPRPRVTTRRPPVTGQPRAEKKQPSRTLEDGTPSQTEANTLLILLLGHIALLVVTFI